MPLAASADATKPFCSASTTKLAVAMLTGATTLAVPFISSLAGLLAAFSVALAGIVARLDASETAHQVFTFNFNGLLVIVPAILVLKALCKPNATLFEYLFRPASDTFDCKPPDDDVAHADRSGLQRGARVPHESRSRLKSVCPTDRRSRGSPAGIRLPPPRKLPPWRPPKSSSDDIPPSVGGCW